jgi:hypothetical protein
MAPMPFVKAWPGNEKSRSGAPQGAVPDRKGASLRKEARLMCSAKRRSTPSAFEGAKRNKAQPARRDKRAAEPWLFTFGKKCATRAVQPSPLVGEGGDPRLDRGEPGEGFS